MGLLDDRQLDSGALGRRLATDPYLRDYALAPRNLLTPNQASLEVDTTGWDTARNGTMARSTAQAANGSASLAYTSNGTSPGGPYSLTSYRVPVTFGRWYTVSLESRAATTGRNAYVIIRNYDAGGTLLSTYAALGSAINSTSAWTKHLGTFTPYNAATVSVGIELWVDSAANAEVHYFDKIGLWEGAGGSWVPGGERLDPGTLGHYWDESVGRREFAWDTVNSRWQLVYGDTGWRMVSGSFSAIAGVTYTSSYMRRIGYQVEFMFGATTSSVVGGDVWTFPSGFKPLYYEVVYGGARYFDAGTLKQSMLGCNASALIQYKTFDAGAGDRYLTLNFQTADAWPATLPGTAVGTIPYN